jgi:hypothetical protein
MGWTISVKLGMSVDVLLSATKNSGMQIGKWAEDIMGKPAFVVSRNNIVVDLVVKSVSELGFDEGANFDQICQAAQKIGLIKCPAEVGPQLRLQYTDQPVDEWLVVAMDSIFDSVGDPRMFLVGHNDRGRWLVGDFGFAEHIYGRTKKFVFCNSGFMGGGF